MPRLDTFRDLSASSTGETTFVNSRSLPIIPSLFEKGGYFNRTAFASKRANPFLVELTTSA